MNEIKIQEIFCCAKEMSRLALQLTNEINRTCPSNYHYKETIMNWIAPDEINGVYSGYILVAFQKD